MTESSCARQQRGNPAPEQFELQVFLAVGEKEQTNDGGWLNENFPNAIIQRIRQVGDLRELGPS